LANPWNNVRLTAIHKKRAVGRWPDECKSHPSLAEIIFLFTRKLPIPDQNQGITGAKHEYEESIAAMFVAGEWYIFLEKACGTPLAPEN